MSYTEQIAIVVLAHPLSWQNEKNITDANFDGSVSPVDALVIINYINEQGSGKLLVPPPTNIVFVFDTNGGGSVSPVDVLIVINLLNATLSTSEAVAGEGEFSLPPLPIQFTQFIDLPRPTANSANHLRLTDPTPTDAFFHSFQYPRQDHQSIALTSPPASDPRRLELDELIDELLAFRRLTNVDDIFAEWPTM